MPLRWLSITLLLAGCKSPSGPPRFAAPAVLASFTEELGHGMTSDEDAVYLTASMGETGFVFRVDKKSGKAQLLAREPHQAVAVRTFGDDVYYTCAHEIRRVSKRGGPSSPVAEIGIVWSMAVADGALWAADRVGELTRVSLPDGKKQRICDAPHIENLVFDDGFAVWREYYSGNPLLWRVGPDGKCLRIYENGGAMALGRAAGGTLVAGEAEGTHRFTYSDDDLLFVPDDGGPPRRLAHLGFVQERAVHGDALYLARTTRDFRAPDNAWEIVRVDKKSAAITLLASAPTTSVEDLTADDSGVYWVGKALDGDGWRLVKIARTR